MLRIIQNIFVFVLLSVSVMAPSGVMAAASQQYRLIEWVDLIPKLELDVLLNPPESIASIPHGGADVSLDQLSGSIADALEKSKKPPTPEEQAYSAALESTNVNTEFDTAKIRIPGFIVPVEYNDDLVITEFFLVPYFGACIHVPPPPPNQIIYVKYPEGITLDVLYDPFWIEGTMSTTLVQNDLATSAYTVSAKYVKPYEAYNK